MDYLQFLGLAFFIYLILTFLHFFIRWSVVKGIEDSWPWYIRDKESGEIKAEFKKEDK